MSIMSALAKLTRLASSPAPEPEPPPAPPPSPLCNAGAFFDGVRRLIGPLKQSHVEAFNALLEATRSWPTSWVAYAMATAWHETGGELQPNREGLNYSVNGLLNTFGRHRISKADAERLGRKPGERPLSIERQRAIANIIYGGQWGRENLGNTQPDDGWNYRGGGMDHCTGRTNYLRAGQAVGIDLLSNPDAILSLPVAVRVMVTGMETGRYTGRKLADYLPDQRGAYEQFRQARQIINGMDRATDIAAYAVGFQMALIDGGRV